MHLAYRPGVDLIAAVWRQLDGSARCGDFCEVAGRGAGQPPSDGATEVAVYGNLGAGIKENTLQFQRAAMNPTKSSAAALRAQRTRRPRGGATEVVGHRGESNNRRGPMKRSGA